jgi:hypothetical protein
MVKIKMESNFNPTFKSMLSGGPLSQKYLDSNWQKREFQVDLNQKHRV